MPDWYKLVGPNHEVVPCDLRQSIEADRSITQTTLPNGVLISTVFLGLDHNYTNTGPPIVFETMVFGGVHDQYCARCATYDEALKMHKKAVNMHVIKLRVVK